jgi:hypothetical protein
MQSPYCSLILIKTTINTQILIKLPNIKTKLALTVPGSWGSNNFQATGTWRWLLLQPYALAAFTHKRYPRYSFLLEAELIPHQSMDQGIKATKNPNDPIRNQTCDLPDCSTVPQPHMPQHTPNIKQHGHKPVVHEMLHMPEQTDKCDKAKKCILANFYYRFIKTTCHIDLIQTRYKSSKQAGVATTVWKRLLRGTEAYLHKHTDLQSLCLHSPKHSHPVPCSSKTQTATLLPACVQSSCLHIPVELDTGSC